MDGTLPLDGPLRLGWRTDACCARRTDDAETPTCPGEETKGEGFFSHKIAKHDTLAGIAIKYDVTLADLKRFNGLLSESGMQCRDVLLIPTKLEPVSEDVRRVFAQIATSLGRDPSLHHSSSDPGLFPIKAALFCEHQGGASWRCRCGASEAAGCCCDGGAAEHLPCSTAPADLPTSSGLARVSLSREQVRRRLRSADGGFDADDADADCGGLLGSITSGGYCGGYDRPFHVMVQRVATEQEGQGVLASLGRAINQQGTVLVDKIKREIEAASQHAATSDAKAKFLEVADGVLAKLRRGLMPKGGLSGIARPEPRSAGGGLSGSSGGGYAAVGSAAAAAAAGAATPAKGGKRD